VAADLAAAATLPGRTRAVALGFGERPMAQADRAALIAAAGLSASGLSRTALAALAELSAAEAASGAGRAARSGA